MRASVLTDRNFAILGKLQQFCEARNHAVHEAALAKPEISTVIVGATKISHVGSNVKALEWQLTADDLAELDAMTSDNAWLSQPRWACDNDAFFRYQRLTFCS